MKHGERKSLRTAKHDYSFAGSYFITICVHHHRCLFGSVEKGCMILNEYGHVAQDEWNDLLERYPGLESNAFIIMPNHIHCIITFTKISFKGNVGAALAADQTTVSNIIGAYKSLVYVHILEKIKSQTPEIKLGKLWQRSFFDRIIHDLESYEHYVKYIMDNPKNWKTDPFNK